MTLNKQKLPLLFEHRTKALFNGEDLASAILLKAKGKPVQQIKCVFKHGLYPAISIGGNKIHIHRLLIEYYIGREIRCDEVSHHANSLKYDARKENLQLMDRAKHASLHNKGKTMTKEHCKKISEALRNRTEPKAMPLKHDLPLATILSFYMDGWTVNRIANHFDVDRSTIKLRLKLIHQHPHLLGRIT